jgi:hypothetical protein
MRLRYMTQAPLENTRDSGQNRWLSEALSALIEKLSAGPVRLADVIDALRGQEWTLLLALISLPFCTPIPLPGLSTPLGLVIALIGFRLLLGKTPHLPRKLLNIQLPSHFFSGLFTATRGLIRLFERFLKPRWSWLLERRPLQQIYGLIILICGILFLLPLPIPLTNTFPALTVLLLACAILERDGYFVVAAAVAFALTLAYFGALSVGGAEAFHLLKHWLFL